MSILNYYQVTDSVASSGQPTEDQFDEIAKGGYETVINLAMPDHENSIATEGSIVTSLGTTYIYIPVPFDAPNEDHFSAFSGYMDALINIKVWVHCIVNARVSTFLFRYLQNRGLSAADAKTPVLEQWAPQMDDAWKEFISCSSSWPNPQLISINQLV